MPDEHNTQENSSVATELLIDFQPIGRNGAGHLTAKVGDQIIHADRVNIVKDADRKRFIAKLTRDHPGIGPEAVANQLLVIASELTGVARAGKTATQLGAADQNQLYSVVDGCLCRTVQTPNGAVTVPLCNFDGKINQRPPAEPVV